MKTKQFKSRSLRLGVYVLATCAATLGAANLGQNLNQAPWQNLGQNREQNPEQSLGLTPEKSAGSQGQASVSIVSRVVTRVVANEVTPQHQALIDELNRRWYETKIPEFLENKKDEEAVLAGSPFPEANAKALLNADAVAYSGKFSSLIDPKVYSSLQHQTKLESVVRKLESGQLRPFANPEAYSRFGVYLELHQHSAKRPFYWANAELHFDYSLLDRTDYHMTADYAYGNYVPESAAPLVNKGRVAFYIREYLASGKGNEIVFNEPVPMSKLVKIVVPTGEKSSLLKQIKAKKLACPSPLGWDKIITEQEMPAPRPAPVEETGE